jgi:hypothetical protein
MKSFEVVAGYKLAVNAENVEQAEEATLAALHDSIQAVIDYIPEDDEEKRLKQVFEWKCMEIAENSNKNQQTLLENAQNFLEDYKALCKKYGLIIETDSYEEPIIYKDASKDEIALHFEKIRIV